MNILDKLYNGKWLMEKKSLYSFYQNCMNRKMENYGNFENKTNLSNIINEYPTDEGDCAVISISGIIVKGCSEEEQQILGLVNPDEICVALDMAAEDASVKYIILWFSSPGGETTGILELGKKIKYIDENIKPIFSFTDSQMASAAAWLGSQARYIGMTESANIGSCGVYMVIMDASKKYEMEGLNPQVISSGKYKTMGQDTKSLTEEENNLLILDVENQHKKFKEIVKSRRPHIKEEALEGLGYEGPEALENGWTDMICDSFQEFLQEINNNEQ